MSYYRILGFHQEPFSGSPDPNFFYESRNHMAVFYRLRATIDLSRGLSVVVGDVGTGKTTLMRKLRNTFDEDPDIVTRIILTPTAESEHTFLSELMYAFHLKPGTRSPAERLRALENYLFEETLRKKKTVILFIDEAQKLSGASMEVLRVLLNYETHENKLIQIVLLGQNELLPNISRLKNLWDRAALKCRLGPLGLDETRELICFRLAQAGCLRPQIFTEEAIKAIHLYSQGYLRKVVMLCHDALEYLIMHQKFIIDKAVIDALVRQEIRPVFAGLPR